MIDIFNNLSVFGKCMVIVLIISFITLIGLVIYLIFKNRKTEDINIDTDFFDTIKKDTTNSKSILTNDIDTNKVKEIATKIEPKEEVEENVLQVSKEEKKISKSSKFDISEVTKQMEEDINNNLELTEFEMEQEEKSIISYEELLRKVKQNNTENNCKVNLQTVDLNDSKKSNDDFDYNTEILDFSDINESSKENTSTLLNQDDLKEMLNISDIDAALYSSDDFLNALKELRDNLE